MPQITLALVELGRGNSIKESLWAARRVLDVLTKADLENIVVLFPENWLTVEALEEESYLSFIETLYGEFGLTMFPGLAYILEDRDRVVSRGYLIGERGVERICEKHYPSKAVGERGRISPGRLRRVVSVKGVKIGCIACVDIFYPELSRLQILDGADLLYNPASIPAGRIPLWRGVLATRAAENIVFTAGVNTVGVVYPDGRITGGGSIVYGPDGEPLRGATKKYVKIYNININYIDEVKKRWAFRDDLFKYISYYK